MTVRTNKPTKVPAAPPVPANVSPELRRYLEQIAETIEIRLGRRGDQRDRAVTLRELIDSGLAKDLKSNPFDPNNTGSTGFTIPGGTLVDLAVPPAPTGFTANGAYSQVNLSWDYPKYANHSLTEIWRHDSDSIGDAQIVGVQGGRFHVDPVGSGFSGYYWVRHVSTSDVKGPFNAASGTPAQTAVDVQHLLTVLTDAITGSQLAQTLEDRIDLIDAAATVTNSVAWRVAQEATARASAITSEATARANAISAIVQGVPLYDSTAAYVVDQIVRIANNNSKLYICIQAVSANSSIPITNTAYWKLYGDYDALKLTTDDSASKIVQINTITATSTSAAAIAIKALQTSVSDPSTGLSATAGALSTLQSAVNHSETGLSATVTDLTQLETALFDDLLNLTAWSNTANYAENARVKHDKKAYRAIQASTSSAPKTPGVDTSFWALDTIAYSSAVSALSSTLTNDYVEATNFTALSTDVYEGAFGGKKWDSSTSFAQGDTVIHQGVAYKALQSNSNSAPPNSNWELSPLVNTQTLTSSIATATNGLATATDLTLVRNDAYNNLTGVPTWSSSTSYSIGDRVVHTDSNNATKIYKAKLANSNSNPSQNLTGSNPKWQLDPSASSVGLSELSSTLTSDYTTTSAMDVLLASKEAAGYAAGLISASEVTAANTYATVTNTDAQYAAIFTEMTGVADWSSSTSYTTGARVIYESGTPPLKRIYRALQNSQNRNPASQTSYWQLDTLAYAAAVSSLEATVSGPNTGLVDKVDGVELRLDDVNGNSTNITMEQRFTAQANEIGDLEAQYTVKVDANGYVSGFGLANTVNNGTPTSKFYVNADQFAILPDRQTTADPAWASGVSYPSGGRVQYGGNLYLATIAHTSNGSRIPSATSAYWVQGDLVPFVVQAVGTNYTNPDGTTTYISPGVYMNSAMIKHAAITAAQIGTVNADVINTGFLDAGRIDANTIEASKLILDNATMTSQVINGVPTLIVNEIAANKVTTGQLDAALITGDVNVFQSINKSNSITLTSANQWYEILDETLVAPDISHLPIASLVMQATKSQSGGTQVDMKITMQLPSGPAAATLGSIASRSITVVGTGSGYMTVYIANISGNVTSSVATGNTIYNSSNTSQTGSVYNVSFSSGVTSIQYTGSTYFTVGTTLVRSAMSASETIVFEGGQDHNFESGQISQAAAGSFSSGVTTSIRVRAYAKKHSKAVIVTKVNGFIGGIR